MKHEARRKETSKPQISRQGRELLWTAGFRIHSGFTLIEILVSISIIIILSAAVLPNLRNNEKQYAQKRGIYKLEGDFRRAENLAMSTQEFGTEVPLGGYGLYFNIAEKDHYILFADLNNDQQYDAFIGELVEDIKFEKGVEIQGLSSSPLTITFLSPDPFINIRPVAQTAIIALNNSRKIKVNTAGLIEIE